MESSTADITIDESDSEGEELSEETMKIIRETANLGAQKDSSGRRKCIISQPAGK